MSGYTYPPITMDQQPRLVIQHKASWLDPSVYIYKILIPCLIWLPQQLAEIFSARTFKKLMSVVGLSSPSKSVRDKPDDCSGFTAEKISESLELIQAKKVFNRFRMS
ncbi:uncharacterized protein LOC108680705 [Hyalella azteca]|uniref:Uncharacterized protein LOC108680705 n=1 Tax=Hyalella azteca TaxID=294128 RepID=A0A8B7PGF8_HYAAZ|nr:uncharacterized protein LOC108680705 [Hyalella azteca]